MLFNKAIPALDAVAELNRTDPLRNGQMLCFPGTGDLFVAGDIHNHSRNFERFRKAAALDKNPDRHVILQELIHGGSLGAQGEDRSMEMLLQACDWARHYPGRVHFLLANHDMAQVQRVPIMKDGYDLTDRFSRYIENTYRGDGPRVVEAFHNFIYSMPLAAITVTGLFLSHSLPDPRSVAVFDQTVLRGAISQWRITPQQADLPSDLGPEPEPGRAQHAEPGVVGGSVHLRTPGAGRGVRSDWRSDADY